MYVADCWISGSVHYPRNIFSQPSAVLKRLGRRLSLAYLAVCSGTSRLHRPVPPQRHAQPSRSMRELPHMVTCSLCRSPWACLQPKGKYHRWYMSLPRSPWTAYPTTGACGNCQWHISHRRADTGPTPVSYKRVGNCQWHFPP